MEKWQDPNTIFTWIIYTLLAFSIIIYFVIQLIYRNIKQEVKRKHELSIIEERHLQELLNKHIKSQEFERERIGSDLHDSVSNPLNVMLMKIRINSDLKDIESDLITTLNTVRHIAHDLNPPMIERIPIESLLLEQFDRLSHLYKIEKWSRSHNKTSWSTEKKIQVIRIIQEVINNIIKHSKSDTIQIKIKETNGLLLISIQDNGIGIASDETGMGMQNIENRIFILKGNYKIKSKINQGTKIIIAVRNDS